MLKNEIELKKIPAKEQSDDVLKSSESWKVLVLVLCCSFFKYLPIDNNTFITKFRPLFLLFELSSLIILKL